MTERLEITDTLKHRDEECAGEWREHRVGRMRCYECSQCRAVARETTESRRAYWVQVSARLVRRKASAQGAIATIVGLATDRDSAFRVALALGEIASFYAPNLCQEFLQAVKAEYERVTADRSDP